MDRRGSEREGVYKLILVGVGVESCRIWFVAGIKVSGKKEARG